MKKRKERNRTYSGKKEKKMKNKRKIFRLTKTTPVKIGKKKFRNSFGKKVPYFLETIHYNEGKKEKILKVIQAPQKSFIQKNILAKGNIVITESKKKIKITNSPKKDANVQGKIFDERKN